MRPVPLALATAAICSAVLGASVTGTFAAFTASITNPTNTAAAGSIVMQETGLGSGGTTVTCTSTDPGSNANDVNTNASTCTTINKFGGATSLYPGGPASTATVNIRNTGTSPVMTFKLDKGTAGCSGTNVGTTPGSASSADVCSQMDLKIVAGSAPSQTTVYDGKVGSFSSSTFGQALVPSPGGASVPITFSVSLPAGAGNTYQGKQVSLPLVWSFSS